MREVSSKVTSPIRQTLIRAFSAHARRQMPLSGAFYKLARNYVSWFEGRTYDGRYNGENWLVQRSASHLKVAFDVGANRGEWSAIVLEHAPNCEVHAFELIPETAQDLQRLLGDRLKANAFGLSDANEELDVIFSEAHDRGSRMIIDEGFDKDYKTVRGEVRIGDEYCETRGIDHIDLLKVDVEGAEQNVLFGFKKMIEDSKIDVIQFEYNHARLHSRFLLRDFYDLLADQFVLGRLTAQGVRFKDYELTDEDFEGPNYVAVLRSRSEIIDRVAIG